MKDHKEKKDELKGEKWVEFTKLRKGQRDTREEWVKFKEKAIKRWEVAWVELKEKHG